MDEKNTGYNKKIIILKNAFCWIFFIFWHTVVGVYINTMKTTFILVFISNKVFSKYRFTTHFVNIKKVVFNKLSLSPYSCILSRLFESLADIKIEIKNRHFINIYDDHCIFLMFT